MLKARDKYCTLQATDIGFVLGLFEAYPSNNRLTEHEIILTFTFADLQTSQSEEASIVHVISNNSTRDVISLPRVFTNESQYSIGQ